ncbi:pilus assembly protein CpaD [Sphingomonas jinjuensis]|uniref:Pilus assembly protein CpaD n=1 Tax=Sphingomonas jinjuensis TaxID=535907 RepID=A0A840FN53_9SPHN|nr:CpaD family pilus assembly lipoprotein [Sphingomonas jinjuensis]MBB4155348.1 pilus assembly protein CpaD [Sphingomonas jinjuensis]
MTKSSLILAAALPALLLGGCMGTRNRGLESVHQPVVTRADYALDLATSGGLLANGESERLNGWLGAMRLGFGDTVSVDDPNRVATGAERQVAAVVGEYGLLLGEPPAVSRAPVTPGTLRVVVSRSRATVPGCPDWSRDASNEFDSNTSSNQGCSVNSNLAAMVARPTDLVHGSSSVGYLDPVIRGRAIEEYRKAAPTGRGGTAVQAAGVAGGK